MSKYQTSRVKVASFPGCCALEQVPSVFIELMPEIIAAIDGSLHQIGQDETNIALFGLQPAIVTISSDLPITLGRVWDVINPRRHFCCTLDYLCGYSYQKTPKTWHNSQSLVLDFTTGFIMDKDAFLSQALNSPMQGNIYAKLNDNKLRCVWAMFTNRQRASRK